MSSRSDGFFPQAETMSPYEKGYRQGRADAIDEILLYYNTNYAKAKMMENGKEPWSYWKNIIVRFEQIKEQNNDKHTSRGNTNQDAKSR